jgi:photosystem II stability/assembly factor-like uncharacterized protein
MRLLRLKDQTKRQGNARGFGSTKFTALGGLALILLVLPWCGLCPIEIGLGQNGDTATVPPTERSEPTGQVRCCRWNHYVVNGGGAQTALVVNPLHPNIVYATMDHGGIVKSTDYGDTWRTINNNIGRARLADVKLDPLNPDILYVTAAYCLGCGQGELYRSLDGGAHWEFITSAFGVETLPSSREIVIVPQDADSDRISDVIYVGAWAGNKGGDKGGIWKSNDEGATWQQIGRVDGDSELLKRANVWVLRSDPSHPNVLYAGMFVYGDSDSPGGIFKSTDGGMKWADITNDIPVPNISDIAISPDGHTLYAATNPLYRPEPGAGIFKSTDGGETWALVNRGLERTSLKFEVLLMDKDDPDVLYTGPLGREEKTIYKTTDGGERWHRTRFDNSGWWDEDFDQTWAIAEGADSKLYVATWTGIYRSDDDGETWLARSQGLGNVRVFDIALDPQNPSTVYLGLADQGPWKSTDGGHSWAQIKDGYYKPYGTRSGSVAAFAISPSDPDVIYSAVKGSSGTTLMGVNKTTDGGRNWRPVNRGLPGPDPAWIATDVVVHPLTPDIAYVGIKIDNGTGGVFKTTDGGENWTELNNVDPEGRLPRVESLAISASDPDIVLVGTREPGRVYKTTDGGETWAVISPPPNSMHPDTIIHEIDIHPLDPEYVVIGVNTQGAYETTNGGRTWAQILSPDFLQDNVGDLALNPEVPVFATIKAVKFDPDDPQIIYAGHDNLRGKASVGVVKSTDGGASWTLLNDPGLQYRNIFVMDIHPQTKELFVGGFDGVYVYEQFFLDQH